MRNRLALGARVVLLAIAVLAIACNRPLHEAHWLVAETPHFEILTTLSAEEALLRRAQTECGRRELRPGATPSLVQLRVTRERGADRIALS